jgi:hypothetical protein
MTTLIQSVIWNERASPRDQTVYLKLVDIYGFNKFTATLAEIGEQIGIGIPLLAKTMVRLRNLEWIESTRLYSAVKSKNVHVTGCEYRLLRPEKD